jgi:hypothetical protein
MGERLVDVYLSKAQHNSGALILLPSLSDYEVLHLIPQNPP